MKKTLVHAFEVKSFDDLDDDSVILLKSGTAWLRLGNVFICMFEEVPILTSWESWSEVLSRFDESKIDGVFDTHHDYRVYKKQKTIKTS